MRRTAIPPKTNIASVAVSLGMAAFVLWMTSYATTAESLFSQSVRTPTAIAAGAEANANRASAD